MLDHIKAVIFDMDGLLLDTESLYRIIWKQACSELGYEISDDFYAAFVGRPTADCESLLSHTFDAFQIERCRERRKVLWTENLAGDGIQLKAGVLELLDFLEQRGLPRAIATSTHRVEAEEYLGELGSRFQVVATGDEVRRGKPAPDIFKLAASRLGVEPGNCLVLEDSPLGATGALAAGMTVVIVRDVVQPTEELARRAHRVCPSLHAVREMLVAC